MHRPCWKNNKILFRLWETSVCLFLRVCVSTSVICMISWCCLPAICCMMGPSGRASAVPPMLIESDTSSRFSVIMAFVFVCHYCEECQTMLRSTCVTVDSILSLERNKPAHDFWLVVFASLFITITVAFTESLSKNGIDFHLTSLCVELKHY